MIYAAPWTWITKNLNKIYKKKKKKKREKEQGSTLGESSSTYGVFFLCASRLKGQMLRRCLFRSANMCPLSLWEWNGKGKPAVGLLWLIVVGMHIIEVRVSLILANNAISRNVLSTASDHVVQFGIFKDMKRWRSRAQHTVSGPNIASFPSPKKINKNPVVQFSHESTITPRRENAIKFERISWDEGK